MVRQVAQVEILGPDRAVGSHAQKPLEAELREGDAVTRRRLQNLEPRVGDIQLRPGRERRQLAAKKGCGRGRVAPSGSNHRIVEETQQPHRLLLVLRGLKSRFRGRYLAL